MLRRRQLLKSGFLLSGEIAAVLLSKGEGRARAATIGPDFTGIERWINTKPVSIDQLRGSVALVNFWTYSCINSRRPLAYLKRWHATYGPLGLRVIGIHTPEFEFEHDRLNVEMYMRQEGIQYPIGLDNEYRTWTAFQNDAWPGFYLLDRNGHVVLTREGEGYGHEIEQALRGALGLTGTEPIYHSGDDPDLSRIRTPETYFGAKHPTPQDSRQAPRLGTANYSFGPTASPLMNEYLLDGTWSREGERLTLLSTRGALRFRFSAAQLYMVAEAPHTVAMRVFVDGEEKPPVEIGWPTLYTVVNGNTYGDHLLEVVADTPSLTLFSMTFWLDDSSVEYILVI